MTTELEKKFFETFGIEPKCETRAEHRKHECFGMVDCDECASAIYPQITDRILLELICVLTKSKAMLPIICSENTQDLKDEILWDLIKAQTQFKKEIKHQVQELFK